MMDENVRYGQPVQFPALGRGHHRHPVRTRNPIRRRLRVVVAVCALWWIGFGAPSVQAQSPVTFRAFSQLLQDAETAGAEIAGAGVEDVAPKRIIIDTDPGVDDAAALAWVLSETDYNPEILGIVATAGNARLEDATRNVLMIRQMAGATHIPVFRGLQKPLVQQLSSTGLLIHGIDGLWSAGSTHPHDLVPAESEAAWRFYCRMAREEPGATIVALGPLTNVGHAIRACGSDMTNFGEIVILGGAQVGGNTTPVAEFNIWQDPEAADLVLTSGMKITLVPLDTFTTLQFTVEDIFPLATGDNPLGQLLGCMLGACPPFFPTGDPVIDGGIVGFSPLGLYLGTQEQAVGEASIPDLVAMMYALDSSLGMTTPALAKVILRPELVRGQTIFGTNPSSKVTMIVDDRELSRLAEAAFTVPFTIGGEPVDLPPGLQLPSPDFLGGAIAGILDREPDNVEIVIMIESDEMRNLFFAALTAPIAEASAAGNLSPSTLAPPLPQLFVPVVDLDE